MELVDIERKDQSFLIEMLCDQECVIFQKILIVGNLKKKTYLIVQFFKNYLVKIKALAKMREYGNSAYESGKFVNLFLSRMYFKKKFLITLGNKIF